MKSNTPCEAEEFLDTKVMPALSELHLLAKVYRKLAEMNKVPGEARIMREVSDNILKLLDPVVVDINEIDMNN